MNLSGSKGQRERETEARSERETDQKKKCVTVCVRLLPEEGEAVDRWMYGDRKTGLVSPVA